MVNKCNFKLSIESLHMVHNHGVPNDFKLEFLETLRNATDI